MPENRLFVVGVDNPPELPFGDVGEQAANKITKVIKNKAVRLIVEFIDP